MATNTKITPFLGLSLEKFLANYRNNPDVDYCSYSPARGKNINKICGNPATETNSYNAPSSLDHRCITCKDKVGREIEILGNILCGINPKFCRRSLVSKEENKENPCLNMDTVAVKVVPEEENKENSCFDADTVAVKVVSEEENKENPCIDADTVAVKVVSEEENKEKSYLDNDTVVVKVVPEHTKSKWISVREYLKIVEIGLCSYSPLFGENRNYLCGNEVMPSEKEEKRNMFWRFQCELCKSKENNHGVDLLFEFIYSLSREKHLEGALEIKDSSSSKVKDSSSSKVTDSSQVSNSKVKKLPVTTLKGKTQIMEGASLVFNDSLESILGEDWLILNKNNESHIIYMGYTPADYLIYDYRKLDFLADESTVFTREQLEEIKNSIPTLYYS